MTSNSNDRSDRDDTGSRSVPSAPMGTHDWPGSSLRQRAEEWLCGIDSRALGAFAPEEIDRLLHELRVHQIELEMQNEELRHAQERLEASRARYFDLYDLAPVGYLTLSERGLIQDANLAAANLLGVMRGDLTHRLLSDFILSEDQDVFYRCRQHLLETRARSACELRLVRQNGPAGWASLETILGVDRETGSMRCLTILSDIGERKRAEAARREEEQRKDGFLAMLGHELRNPLAPIRHAAEILRIIASHPDPARIQQVAELLSRQVDHLGHMVDDLLDVARVGRGGIRLATEPCDLRAITENAAEQVRPLMDRQGQHLELALPSDPVNLIGDPVRLAQMIVNLLRNASQFSPPEGWVSLTLETADAVAVLRVRDQGSGLDPQLLANLFEPFVQADQTSERAQGGLGMGLPLVKGLVELHGGSVEAASLGPGQGSTFSLRLPLSSARAEEASGVEVGRPLAHNILVVDDNSDVADACALLLSLLGQRVDTAADGPSALAAAEHLRPDLILLDLGLPGMDGFEVARRLRATEAGRAARLVAVTGYGQDKDRERSKAAGFDEHLLKPMRQEVLVAALARCPVLAAGGGL